jgi:predicted CXXCH cytochrome family protein
MKKVLIASMALGATLGMASASNAVISGSAHDFSSFAWSNNQICLPCHTPHNAKGSATTAGPLWNHEATTASYTVYTSPTLDAGALGQPAGISKACLSCHDGTIALEAFGTATTGSIFAVGTANLGTDLSNDHPISFDYVAVAGADPGINAASTVIADANFTDISDWLFNNEMQCASCHDVHNKYGNSNLLLISNAGSALCLTCHNK